MKKNKAILRIAEKILSRIRVVLINQQKYELSIVKALEREIGPGLLESVYELSNKISKTIGVARKQVRKNCLLCFQQQR